MLKNSLKKIKSMLQSVRMRKGFVADIKMLFVTVVVGAFLLSILGGFSFTADSAAANATDDGIDAIGTIFGYLDDVASLIVVVIIMKLIGKF